MPSVIQQPVLRSSSLNIEFDTNNYPSAGEVAGWTLTLGGGVELPFTEASSFGNNRWTFTYTPGWADDVPRQPFLPVARQSFLPV